MKNVVNVIAFYIVDVNVYTYHSVNDDDTIN